MSVTGQLHQGYATVTGIRDAIFGSLASAFNDYLDLGAGVMILWYGGVIAMSPE